MEHVAQSKLADSSPQQLHFSKPNLSASDAVGRPNRDRVEKDRNSISVLKPNISSPLSTEFWPKPNIQPKC